MLRTWIKSSSEAIRKQHLVKQKICQIVSAYPMSRRAQSNVQRKPVSQEVSIRSDGRAMDPRGTAAPPCQTTSVRRAPAQGRYAGSPQPDSVSPSEWVSMGYATPRFTPAEHRL